MSRVLLLLVTVLTSISLCQARELAGVQIPDQVTIASETLKLNGSGIRSKFFFDIYVAAFYTQHPVHSMADITLEHPMRLAMHFVYKEVDKEKLVDAMNEGFDDNLSADELATQSINMKQVNDWFETMHEGGTALLDYVPGKGTVVIVNGHEKGAIADPAFYTSLLKIWLGTEPATEKLKAELFGVAASASND